MLKKLALTGVLLTIFVFSFRPITDNDLWWHLRTGSYIIENHKIPNSDFYSYTNYGKEWIDHEWLAQVIFFFVYHEFGAIGLVLAKSIFVVSTFYLLYLRSRLHMGGFFSIITLYVAASLSWNMWLERPMIFTFFFVSLLLYLLDLYDKDVSDKLFIIPPLIIVWANLHGGFILGILIMITYFISYWIAGEKTKTKRLLFIIGISLLASAINPQTYRLLLYPIQYSYQNVHSLFILEWQSPIFHTPSIFEFMLLGLIFIFAKSRPTNLHILLALIFVHLSLFAIRNIFLFALVVTPILLMYVEKYLVRAFEGRDHGAGFNTNTLEKFFDKMALPQDIKRGLLRRFLPAFLYAIVILAFVIPFYNYLQFGPAFDTSPRGFPEEAVEYLLTEKPKGNLFNLYGWGGYVIWKAYPEYRVFIDGRADMYDEFIYEYLNVYRLKPTWKETLDRYDVKIILIHSGDQLDILLEETSEWRVGYRDELAVIYIRD
ncbi:MAG: hypothetical protein V3V92_01320 [Candidatus Hydrothermarchaeales archaeon]